MSTIRELIQSALTDEPQGRQAIAEQVGVEAQHVSAELNNLQAKGLAARSNGGWIAGDASVKAPRVHTAPEPVAEPRPAAKARRAKKASMAKAPPKARAKAKPRDTPRRKKKAMAAEIAPPKAATRINGAQRECEFAIAESGAILFKVTAGPRAGQLGSINHVDAMALFRLMDSCDFIRENA